MSTRSHPRAAYELVSCAARAGGRVFQRSVDGLAVALRLGQTSRESTTEPTDVTIEILIGIHNEIRATNSRLDTINSRIDDTNGRLDTLTGRVDQGERRRVESEIRLATEIVALAGVVREIRDVIRDDLSVRHDVRDLQQRVGVLEGRRQ